MHHKDQRLYEIRHTDDGYDTFIDHNGANFKISPTDLFYQATIEILMDYFDTDKIDDLVNKYMVDFYQSVYEDYHHRDSRLPYKMCGITIREFIKKIDENEH
jgi:hypothetical protein